MAASTKLIKIRIVGATTEIETIANTVIADLSKNLKLVERSKVYPSRNNPNEARVYLGFKQKEGATPGATDAVMGGK